MTTSPIQVALVTGKNEITIEEFLAPQPSEGKAVVDISYCGICGTDLHAFLSGAVSYTHLTLPTIYSV